MIMCKFRTMLPMCFRVMRLMHVKKAACATFLYGLSIDAD